MIADIFNLNTTAKLCSKTTIEKATFKETAQKVGAMHFQQPASLPIHGSYRYTRSAREQ